MANRTKRTAKREAALLGRLRAGESVYGACQAAGIVRNTYYEWRKEDDGFAVRADDAIDDGTDVLEDVLLSTAVRGNVAALLAALRARRRHVWGERVTNAHEGDITIRVVYADDHD